MGRLQYKVEYQRFPRWDVERLDQNRDSVCKKSPNTWHEEHEEAGNDPGGLGGGALAKLGDNEQAGCVAGDRGLEYYSSWHVSKGQELETCMLAGKLKEFKNIGGERRENQEFRFRFRQCRYRNFWQEKNRKISKSLN